MSDDQKPGNTQKDPDEWKTGDERATGAQISYIETMATEVGEKIDTSTLTKADAAKVIEELQKKTGRGQGTS